jgi:hypothetical protein
MFLISRLAQECTRLDGRNVCQPGPSPPPPGSTSLEYRKQHQSLEPPAIDMASFRRFWKVRARIDKLLAAGDITGFEWRCASEFRMANEIAFGSLLRAPRLDGTGRGSGHPANLQPSEHQRGALRRLHDLHDRVDRETLHLLELIVVMDLK